ncbi:AI-2E family transporter [Natronobiforma cellulositropha]|uniref:AI-2E family transporter n=1 Tax=Natronobiforma cellulositropha TaxID=1679076 RepID=UPI0021D59818|nr:AI-2E family transporter [Natronobiforma cellulositropha]
MDVRIGFFALLLAILGALATLMVLPLLQYVLAAALLAFVLYPAHERLTGLGVELGPLELSVGPRLSATLLTGFALVAAVVPLLVFSVVILQTALSYLESFDEVEAVETARDFLREAGVDEEALVELETMLLTELEGVLTGGVEVIFQEMIGLVNTSIQMGLGLLVLVFLLYYLLVDGKTLVAWIGSVAPLEEEVREELFEEIDVVTWAVMKSHVLVAVVEGLLGGLGLYLLGVPNVTFWTVVMIVVSFLPAIGVWLVWGPAVAYLAVTGDPVQAVALLLYGIAVLSVVDNYLRAIFVDRGSGLHPAVVLVGVIGGIYLLGIMGLFLGPVLLAVFKAGLTVFGDVYDVDDPSSSLPAEASPPTPESGAPPDAE